MKWIFVTNIISMDTKQNNETLHEISKISSPFYWLNLWRKLQLEVAACARTLNPREFSYPRTNKSVPLIVETCDSASDSFLVASPFYQSFITINEIISDISPLSISAIMSKVTLITSVLVVVIAVIIGIDVYISRPLTLSRDVFADKYFGSKEWKG